MFKFILPFIFYTSTIFSQNWIKLPHSKILYSNYIQDKKDNFSDFSFEYYKKGDSLISIAKFLSNDFYTIFNENPKAFDDIYKVAYKVINKPELILKTGDRDFIYLDSIIASVDFKTTVIIDDRNFVSGFNEFIWVLKNASGENINFEPCFINMVFHKGKKKAKYISTVKSHCEI